MKKGSLLRSSILTLLTCFPLVTHANAEENQKDLISEFTKICLAHGRSAVELDEGFIGGGWDNVTKEPSPKISTALNILKEKVKTGPANFNIDGVKVFELKLEIAIFEATVITSHFETRHFVDCQMVDFQAIEKDFPTKLPEQLYGRHVDKTEQTDSKIYEWKHPQSFPGFDSISIGYYTMESELAKKTGVNGIIMTSVTEEKE
jgi:hypothetical protein